MGKSESQNLDALVTATIARVTSELGANDAPHIEAELSAEQIADMIDHTVLKPDTVGSQIDAICDEAREYNFASVCVNPTWISRCVDLLVGSNVAMCAVAGFPLGANSTAAKAFEAADAVATGAEEVDMVVNVGRLRDGEWQAVHDDVAAVAEAVHAGSAILKVILETNLLTDEQIIAGSILCKTAGADFVKTATGFSGGGATVEAVRLMRTTVGPALGVKASGGVRTASDVRKMAAAGATRIGASAGVAIMQDVMGIAAAASTDGDDY